VGPDQSIERGQFRVANSPDRIRQGYALFAAGIWFTSGRCTHGHESCTRGGHGEEASGAVHPCEGGVGNATTLLAIACGKLGLVSLSRAQIETFKPPSADDPVLNEVVRRLVEVYHPLRIYLFGSAARGDAGPDSDYDIMVLVPDDAPREQQDCEIGYRALWGVGLAKDILVWTKFEFEKRLHLRASLPSTIMLEGKLLYAAR
jgi:predicted nucleotidyltransferase